MARPVMEIHGLKEFRDALEKAPGALRSRASDAVSASTFAAANRARGMVPRDTGRLSRAIHTDVRGTSGRVMISDDAYYWRMVEFGTIYQNARPFARPAAEEEAPNFEKRLTLIARDFSASRFL